MDWINLLQGFAVFYAIAGAGGAIIAWHDCLSKPGHGWFHFARCKPLTRDTFYRNASTVGLWTREIFAVVLATLVFVVLWWLVVPAMKGGRS